MRVLRILLSIILAVALATVEAKKSSGRPRTVSSAGRKGASRPLPSRSAPRRRAAVEEEEDEDEDILGYPEDDFEEEEEEEEEMLPPKSRRSSGGSASRRQASSSRTAREAAIHRSSASSRKRPPAGRRHYEDEYDDEEEEEEDYRRPRSRSGGPQSRRGGRGPPPSRGGRYPSGGRRGGRSGSVVPYAKPGAGAAAAFTRGISALRESLPDPSTVRNAAASSLSAARATTSNLSSNIYREVKGLTSSELEQVMLKATRPDDTAVKGKHVERLVGVTYQISARYDIYDAVLRKLWAKMVEKDWRTTIKALYILHRFSSDGAPEHAPALKARLRELRRTRDPKRKDKYFNSKQLLAGDSNPENIKFRAFMSRYAHYVLLRVQCFGGMFDEISQEPKADKKKKAAPRPITSTSLRVEHLEAAAMLLKAGVACQMKPGEECENTAIATERVASDLIGLTSAVAMALNRALKSDDLKGADPALLKKWCEFYSEELLPQTRAMVKKTSPSLDAYGLFLPSRMGTSVSPELLQKGLNLEEGAGAAATEQPSTEVEAESEESAPSSSVQEETKPGSIDEEAEEEEEDEEEEEPEAGDEEEEDEFDEYEYEEEEYYDDDEEL